MKMEKNVALSPILSPDGCECMGERIKIPVFKTVINPLL